ncbi:hypothetical protein C8Q80DRAFT_921827 [Daedaleopsis nitida]|nr:hypothetical protein C8Q80DRAFT_921827 [Daedaleopsis nitida]
MRGFVILASKEWRRHSSYALHASQRILSLRRDARIQYQRASDIQDLNPLSTAPGFLGRRRLLADASRSRAPFKLGEILRNIERTLEESSMSTICDAPERLYALRALTTGHRTAGRTRRLAVATTRWLPFAPAIAKRRSIVRPQVSAGSQSTTYQLLSADRRVGPTAAHLRTVFVLIVREAMPVHLAGHDPNERPVLRMGTHNRRRQARACTAIDRADASAGALYQIVPSTFEGAVMQSCSWSTGHWRWTRTVERRTSINVICRPPASTVDQSVGELAQ